MTTMTTLPHPPNSFKWRDTLDTHDPHTTQHTAFCAQWRSAMDNVCKIAGSPTIHANSAVEDPTDPIWFGNIVAALTNTSGNDFGLPFALRRQMARNAMNMIFANQTGHTYRFGFRRSAVEDALKSSPYTFPRTTYAALRDAVTLPAITDLLSGNTSPDLFLEAIRSGRCYNVGGSTSLGQVRSSEDAYADLYLGGTRFYHYVWKCVSFEYGATLIQTLLPKLSEADARNVWAAFGAHVKRMALPTPATTTTTTTTETTPMTKTSTASTAAAEDAVRNATLRRLIDSKLTDAMLASACALHLRCDHGITTPDQALEHERFESVLTPFLEIYKEFGGNPSRAGRIGPNMRIALSHLSAGRTDLDSTARAIAPVFEANSNAEAGESVPVHASSAWRIITDIMQERGQILLERDPAEPAPEVASAPAVESDTPITVEALNPDPSVQAMLNAVLNSAKLPSIEEIDRRLKETAKIAEEQRQEALRWKGVAAKARPAPAPIAASGEIPEGKVVIKSAADVFAGAKGLSSTDMAKLAKVEIYAFEWASDHPHVPAIDEHYIFRIDSLLTLLWALHSNKQPWIQGHTGTGKSTLVMQVAARIQQPVVRINFDSDISRLDLIGRDTLTTDPSTGTTITKWVDGVLPMALRGPNLLLLDEIDFVRPDVGYVLQPLLEGNGLLLNENGGERVTPHEMFRLVGTANTVGQGDEFGLYAGARPQSAAMLDRFRPFIKVPYLSKAEEVSLIQARHPGIDKDVADSIGKYVAEHREAFTRAQIIMPISPRGVDSIADGYSFFYSVLGSKSKALTAALEAVITDKASEQDRAVITGLIKRVSVSS